MGAAKSSQMWVQQSLHPCNMWAQVLNGSDTQAHSLFNLCLYCLWERDEALNKDLLTCITHLACVNQVAIFFHILSVHSYNNHEVNVLL